MMQHDILVKSKEGTVTHIILNVKSISKVEGFENLYRIQGALEGDSCIVDLVNDKIYKRMWKKVNSLEEFNL